MRTLLVALGLLMAVSVAGTASAIEYPWCANLGKDIGATNCGFTTLEQCRATISGNGGFCEPNSQYRTPYPSRPARKLVR
jgi:hypothetical protein